MLQEQKSNKVRIVFATTCAVLALATALFSPGKLRRTIHETLLQKVTTAHYEVLFPAGTISPDAMRQFALQREAFFEPLNRKLGDLASNDHLTLVFDVLPATKSAPPYTVEGRTIRTTFDAQAIPKNASSVPPHLDPAADAEALLNVAWGKPATPQIGVWTAHWLVGNWQGQDLGMAAAEAEKRTGFKNVAALLSRPQDFGMTLEDRTLLASAWINELAELGGLEQVHKLYSARLSKQDIAEVTKALGTTAPELERKWQLWLYANIAGMPAGSPHTMTMPMPK